MNNVETQSLRTVYRDVAAGGVYRIDRAPSDLRIAPPLDDAAWAFATGARVDRFHQQSSDHRPLTIANVLHNDAALFLRFTVRDRFVRCVHSTFQSRVSRDSCVEFFLLPDEATGYFNFEVNCGGTLLAYFISDPRRGQGDRLFQQYEELPASAGEQMNIVHTLPARVEPERVTPVDWQIAITIPREVVEAYVPGAWSRRDRPWRGNFFKCGDDTSHPHWAAWSDIGPTLRFHQPDRFGTLVFDMQS